MVLPLTRTVSGSGEERTPGCDGGSDILDGGISSDGAAVIPTSSDFPTVRYVSGSPLTILTTPDGMRVFPTEIQVMYRYSTSACPHRKCSSEYSSFTGSPDFGSRKRRSFPNLPFRLTIFL